MSGSAGVPFAIWAVFAGETCKRIISATGAAACLVFAAYRIWAAEKKKLEELRSQLKIVAAPWDQTAAIEEQSEASKVPRQPAGQEDTFGPNIRAFRGSQAEQTLLLLMGQTRAEPPAPPGVRPGQKE